MNYKEALENLENGKIKNCINYFKENDYTLEYGYCLLLSGNLEDAEIVFSSTNSLRADWALKIIPIIKGYIREMPTYFQIRNFLEIDITLFTKANRTDCVQYIIGAADSFQSINSETYKFIARALLKNGYKNASKAFLDKSLDVCYSDPELHYLFVEYYLACQDIENAKIAVQKCLNVDSNYFPAKSMKQKLC